MAQSTISLRITDMPTEMRAYGFPCAETDCWTLGTKELELQSNGVHIKVALCEDHAERLSSVEKTRSNQDASREWSG